MLTRLSHSWLKTGKTKIHRQIVTHVKGSEQSYTTKNTIDDVETPQDNDPFTKEFLKNRIQITDLQRLVLSVGSSIASLVDPRR
jgi:ubiquinone biosynthesis protein COQ4